jgi:cytochrome c peroxidase
MPSPAPSQFRNLLALVLALAGLGCTGLCATDLQLHILPLAGQEPLKLDSLTHQNTAGDTWSVTRLSYFVSGVSLQRPDATWLDCPTALAWLNATSNRNSVLVQKIPPGDYHALKFHVGLTPSQNASDAASHPPEHPLNPNLNGLHWSWLGGYIFFALEGRFHTKDNPALQGYAYHLARDPFRTAITLPCKLSLQKNASLNLGINIATLFDGVSPISFARDGTSTHSKDGDPLATALQSNLARSFSLLPETPPNQKASPEQISKTFDLPATYTAYKFELPGTFPLPALPKDNPLINERIALGLRLFHETALSKNNRLSCASCHLSEAALTDPRQFSLGIENRHGNRNAMPLFNLAWKSAFFWDGRSPSLRAQVLQPIQDHREMDESLENVTAKLAAMPSYQDAFQKAFGSGQITAHHLSLALENFLLTLTSFNSKFDRAHRGEVELTDLEKLGFQLFMTEREPRLGSMGGDCFHCHGGALFTDHQFRNNGLAIDEKDLGRFLATKASLDRGAFSTPSLRNVALTAPYMHDGRFATLEQVLDHYSEGIQYTDTLDPNLAKHPGGGLLLSPEDKQALIAFLKTLTDTQFVSKTEPPKAD